MAEVLARLEARLGKKAEDVDLEEDLTLDLAREVLGVSGSVAALEEQVHPPCLPACLARCQGDG